MILIKFNLLHSNKVIRMFGLLIVSVHIFAHLGANAMNNYSDDVNTTLSYLNSTDDDSNETMVDVNRTSEPICTPGPSSPECEYHGTCDINGTSCMCDYGYVDFPLSEGMKRCIYKQKSIYRACFLQALPIPGLFGGGYFYLQYPSLWAPIFLSFMFICFFVLCWSHSSWGLDELTKRRNHIDQNVRECKCLICKSIVFGWLFAVIAYWICGSIIICTQMQVDGNSIPLIP